MVTSTFFLKVEVYYSHSVVSGGFDVKSYMIWEIPDIFLTPATIFNTTSTGISWPEAADTPVMKSLVIMVQITTDLWHKGYFWSGSQSKCKGVKITGIWLIFPAYPDSLRTLWASKSAWHKVLSTPTVLHPKGLRNLQLNPPLLTSTLHTNTHTYTQLAQPQQLWPWRPFLLASSEMLSLVKALCAHYVHTHP